MKDHGLIALCSGILRDVAGDAVLTQIIEGVFMRPGSYVTEVERLFRILDLSIQCYFFKFYAEHFLESHEANIFFF